MCVVMANIEEGMATHSSSYLENPCHKESDTTKVTYRIWTIYLMSDSFLIRFLLFTYTCEILVENLSLFFCFFLFFFFFGEAVLSF